MNDRLQRMEEILAFNDKNGAAAQNDDLNIAATSTENTNNNEAPQIEEEK